MYFWLWFRFVSVIDLPRGMTGIGSTHSLWRGRVRTGNRPMFVLTSVVCLYINTTYKKWLFLGRRFFYWFQNLWKSRDRSYNYTMADWNFAFQMTIKLFCYVMEKMYFHSVHPMLSRCQQNFEAVML